MHSRMCDVCTCIILLLFLILDSPILIIDGYTIDATRNSPATLSLGATIILKCRVSGIPHGLQTKYHWTCPNGPCQRKGFIGRQINNNVLAINITSISDGGTYTCYITTEEMEASQSFQLFVSGQCFHSHSIF